MVERYEFWLSVVRLSGPGGLRAIRGFNDEALSGEWKGLRSSRLNEQWRVIYRLEASALSVYVMRVSQHDYRRCCRGVEASCFVMTVPADSAAAPLRAPPEAVLRPYSDLIDRALSTAARKAFAMLPTDYKFQDACRPRSPRHSPFRRRS
jgi:hypothetical protein